MTPNKIQLFWLIYLFLVSSTCFGRRLRPSSGALDCIFSFLYRPPTLLPAGVTDEMGLLLQFHLIRASAVKICMQIRNDNKDILPFVFVMHVDVFTEGCS